MSAGRPASLDGSLLARKGDATPAIPPNSVLTEELGEPRPEPVPISLGSGGSVAAPSGWAGASVSRQKIMSALLLVILAAALLFAALRLLPTTVTVTSTSPAITKLAAEIVENKAGDVTANATETPEKLMPNESVSTKPTAEAPSVLVNTGTGKIAAKKAPVVVLVPKATRSKLPKRSPAVRSGRYLLQLASLPSAREARRELTRLHNRLRPVLGKRKIAVIRAVPKGKGPVYRLRASAYRTQNSARAACDRIKKLKIACLVVRR